MGSNGGRQDEHENRLEVLDDEEATSEDGRGDASDTAWQLIAMCRNVGVECVAVVNKVSHQVL